MRTPHRSAVPAALALLAALAPGAAPGAEKTELRGDAILEHACGRLAVRHTGLLHAGRFEEAFALATPEARAQWDAIPEARRKAIYKALRETAPTESELAADIRRLGVLEVEGDAATLTVEKTTKTENGSMTETFSQRYVLEGEECRITK